MLTLDQCVRQLVVYVQTYLTPGVNLAGAAGMEWSRFRNAHF